MWVETSEKSRDRLGGPLAGQGDSEGDQGKTFDVHHHTLRTLRRANRSVPASKGRNYLDLAHVVFGEVSAIVKRVNSGQAACCGCLSRQCSKNIRSWILFSLGSQKEVARFAVFGCCDDGPMEYAIFMLIAERDGSDAKFHRVNFSVDCIDIEWQFVYVMSLHMFWGVWYQFRPGECWRLETHSHDRQPVC